jgi:hypothetical protein
VGKHGPLGQLSADYWLDQIGLQPYLRVQLAAVFKLASGGCYAARAAVSQWWDKLLQVPHMSLESGDMELVNWRISIVPQEFNSSGRSKKGAVG